MRIIRCQPATGNKPLKIVCARCGKRATEAGMAVPDKAVEHGYGPDGPIVHAIVDEHEIQPLCESCVNALLRTRRTQAKPPGETG
jgi:hypothetical protein